MTGGIGRMHASKSADPERDVEALLPCLAIMRREEARMEEVVLMLNVLCESPPVPTMSHYRTGKLLITDDRPSLTPRKYCTATLEQAS
jgi:hypothetical protein